MSARRLPRDPSIKHLRKQAKTLQKQAVAGDSEAAALVRELHPNAPEPARVKRTDAQLVLARSYGFQSWPRLREHVETLERFTRRPHLAPMDEPSLADRFVRAACLTYGGDDPARREEARELLAAHPELPRASIAAAAAAGEVEAARELLAADPASARRTGGVHDWEPLLYACYSRLASAPDRSTLEVARLLLEHGADPNAGYLWDGAYPFTALTGAFGYGEDAPNQPPHEHEAELARLLLDAGADPNDSQALYNNHWRPTDGHLELLFSHGLGTGDGGPWARRLAPHHPTPTQLLEDQLLFAAANDRPERVALLLAHGVDPDGRGTSHPTLHGRSAYELARGNGAVRVAELLEHAGATGSALEPVDELVAACMRGDGGAVDTLVAADPALAAQAVALHPAQIATAVALGRAEAVRLLARVGLDVSHKERNTPLHTAAWNGDRELADLLLSLGADPNARDDEFNATPSGWARHAHHEELATYLEGLER
jgi:ankyrin repeat protein